MFSNTVLSFKLLRMKCIGFKKVSFIISEYFIALTSTLKVLLLLLMIQFVFF